MARILIVEDCADTCALVERTLSGYETRCAGSAGEALRCIDARVPDLVVLDLGLPDGDGFGVLEALREAPGGAAVPVLFLSASRATRDKVAAFALGAEDYVEKPFDRAELRARVEARLRASRAAREEIVRVGPLCLDLGRMTVSLRDGSDAIDLTPHEFRLLLFLGRRGDRVATRDGMLDEVWPGVAVSRRTVDTHVSNLRRKLAGTTLRIEPVRGFGYRLRFPDESETSSR